jgi:hypothetical protein
VCHWEGVSFDDWQLVFPPVCFWELQHGPAIFSSSFHTGESEVRVPALQKIHYFSGLIRPIEWFVELNGVSSLSINFHGPVDPCPRAGWLHSRGALRCTGCDARADVLRAGCDAMRCDARDAKRGPMRGLFAEGLKVGCGGMGGRRDGWMGGRRDGVYEAYEVKNKS